MKKLLEKIEALMAAAAFAEEGEVEAAREILAEAGVGEAGEAEAKGDPSTPYRPRAPKPSGA